MSKIIPRGIRNNNPLNIRIGNVWLGEVPNPTDPEFEQFVSMIYGMRAAFVLLRRYIRHYHRDTIAAIVSAWAPRVENNTIAYIDYVASQLGISPDTPVKYEDRDTMVKLLAAMSRYECAAKLSSDDIIKAYQMA